MTTLTSLIEMGGRHEEALGRTLTLAADLRISGTAQAWRDLQDALAGHLLPLDKLSHLLQALAGMLLRHADHSATADAEGELAAASELLSEAISGIATAGEHEQAAAWALEEQRAAGLGVGFAQIAAE